MQIKNHNTVKRTVKKNNQDSNSDIKTRFKSAAKDEKADILRFQAEKLFEYYTNDTEWKEFQAIDVKDE